MASRPLFHSGNGVSQYLAKIIVSCSHCYRSFDGGSDGFVQLQGVVELVGHAIDGVGEGSAQGRECVRLVTLST